MESSIINSLDRIIEDLECQNKDLTLNEIKIIVEQLNEIRDKIDTVISGFYCNVCYGLCGYSASDIYCTDCKKRCHYDCGGISSESVSYCYYCKDCC